MKHKISTKLFVYFLAALLISTSVTGTLFSLLMTRHITTKYKKDLMRSGKVMARIISRVNENDRGRNRNPLFAVQGIREIALTEVWLVNKDMSVTAIRAPEFPPDYKEKKFEDGKNLPPPPPLYQHGRVVLPPGTDTVLQKAFSGETFVTEVFNPVLETKSLTVGTPVFDREGNISNVLLLHSPIVGLREVIRQSISIFIFCIAAAFAIAIIAGIILSLSFTKPLKKMSIVAKKMADGDYEIHTGVNEKNELGELARSMDHLAVKLKDASHESARLEKMRRDFIANISHELRTPVTVIRGSLEALRDGVVSDEKDVAEYREQMLKETIHLQRLVNDLLELSRLQTVDFKIEQNPFDIKAAVREAVRSIQKTANEKNIEIEILGTEEPKIIVGDFGRIREMFMIILDNAVKFSPAGTVQKKTPVRVMADSETVIVEDCGSGISAEDLPHIFERFQKENSERNRGGTGLGLAIAKEISVRHGMQLFAESPVSQSREFPGTRFICRLN